jgi:hypothetical protein
MNPYLERILNTPSPPPASAKTMTDAINAARSTREDDAVSTMSSEISHCGIDHNSSFMEDTPKPNPQQALSHPSKHNQQPSQASSPMDLQ